MNQSPQKRNVLIVYLVLGMIIACTGIWADPLSVEVASSEIRIDGRINEMAWKNASRLGLKYEWTPGDNVDPPVKTECFITFDKNNLYIAFRCFDPDPKNIRAHLMGRDDLSTFLMDDYVVILIDPFNDERRGFQFRVNPLGVQADANFSELEGYEDFSWDAIWDSSGKITEFGYEVEIAIPFNQLRFPVTAGKQTWGFSFFRAYPRNNSYSIGSHIRDRNRTCYLCQANKLTGFEGMSAGKNLEFDPTLTVTRTDEQADFPRGDFENGKIEVQPGITGRWGITPNLILNAAVNPDFSHVEADAAQLEVNTRFTLQYPEKRPFFLEGGDFFLTPLEAVFTRTVSDPLWGAKLTGKIGRNALGFFSAQDRYNNLIFPSNAGSVATSMDKDIYGGVFRYRRDVGKGSALGLLYTGRVGDDYHNHVAGVDGFFRLSKAKFMNIQFLNSNTDYPQQVAADFGQPMEAFSGNAFLLNFRHQGRNLQYGFDYEELDQNFRADSGFIPRVDMRRFMGYFTPIFWGKKNHWFQQLVVAAVFERITDKQGNLTDQTITLLSTYTGPLQTVFRPTFKKMKEYYNGSTYDLDQFQFHLQQKPVGGLKYYVDFIFGDNIDYNNSRKASVLAVNPGVRWCMGKNWNIDLSHIYQRLHVAGETIFSANLLQGQLIYNMNLRTFLRATVQYTNIQRNVDMYTFAIDPEYKTLFTQFLFSYRVNPQTVLYLGYSDNQFGWYGLDLTRKDRTFFLKIGYAFIM